MRYARGCLGMAIGEVRNLRIPADEVGLLHTLNAVVTHSLKESAWFC